MTNENTSYQLTCIITSPVIQQIKIASKTCNIKDLTYKCYTSAANDVDPQERVCQSTT